MLRLTKPWLDNNEAEAVRKVLESGWLSEGVVTRDFETAVARYVDAKFAVAVSNCTIALTLCLKAYGLKRRDQVLMPDFTHPATAQAILNAGASPVLGDVSLDSYNLIGNGCTYATAMPVSWAGNPLTWYPRSLIIEDAACSLGATVDGHPVGSIFTSCFSLHPRKLITTGEGAVITTNDAELSAKLRSLKSFGQGGGNYRFDDIRAAVGLEQLKKLPNIIKVRREMAEIYRVLLADVKGVRAPAPSMGHIYQTYGVVLENADRDVVIRKLAGKGIETQIGTNALHLMPQFRGLKRVGKLESSALLARRLLALPMAHDLTFDDQKYVVEELKNAISRTPTNA